MLRDGAVAGPDDLREFARAHLARHKAPKVVELTGALPKTATGKVQKHVLRERARAQTGSEVAGERSGSV